MHVAVPVGSIFSLRYKHLRPPHRQPSAQPETDQQGMCQLRLLLRRRGHRTCDFFDEVQTRLRPGCNSIAASALQDLNAISQEASLEDSSSNSSDDDSLTSEGSIDAVISIIDLDPKVSSNRQRRTGDSRDCTTAETRL